MRKLTQNKCCSPIKIILDMKIKIPEQLIQQNTLNINCEQEKVNKYPGTCPNFAC